MRLRRGSRHQEYPDAQNPKRCDAKRCSPKRAASLGQSTKTSSMSASIDVFGTVPRLVVTVKSSWCPRQSVAGALTIAQLPVLVHCFDTSVVDTALVRSRATTLTLLRVSTHATRSAN